MLKYCIVLVFLAGLINAEQGGKIVGGQEAQPHSIPWAVTYRSPFLFCTGILYDKSHIITAGHCCSGVIPRNWKVTAGEHSLSSNDGQEQSLNVISVTPHPDYGTPAPTDNDVCIVALDGEFQFNNAVQPVVMPEQGFEMNAGTDVTVSGWGLLSENGQMADTLQTVTVQTLSQEECKKKYVGMQITDNMFCAQAPGKDACSGDSGGPVTTNYDGSEMLVGVVSWGRGCARPRSPGVYAKVANYVDWFADNAL